MIRTFTSWRGLLAVEVVLFHYSNNYVLAIVTSFAMTFFFMVSGFQLAGCIRCTWWCWRYSL